MSKRRLGIGKTPGETPQPIIQAEEGAVMIEFAIILPIMVMLFLGMVEFGEAFTVDRKLTSAASTVSDLVAQGPKITPAELSDIADVAEEIIKPYRLQNFALVISSVQADANNNAVVRWSYAEGTGATARAQGSSVTLPLGLTEPNSSVILTETTYQFTPSVGMFLTGVIGLNSQAYFRPRVTRVVMLDD